MVNFFSQYFTHEEDIFASDPSSRSDEGDLVLVRRMHKPMQKNVEHQVENVLQRLGDVKELVSKLSSHSLSGFLNRDFSFFFLPSCAVCTVHM